MLIVEEKPTQAQPEVGKQPKKTQYRLIGLDALNFIIAVSAILISAASFYATYLQAQAAEKQVKAMTLPLMYSTTGNYDTDKEQSTITLKVKNAGIGPALVKSLSYHYQGKEYQSYNGIIKDCCNQEYQAFVDNVKLNDIKNISQGIMSSSIANTMLASQAEITLFGMTMTDANLALWQKLNHERFNIELSICYCSMLDQCFFSERNGHYQEVEQCPTRMENNNE